MAEERARVGKALAAVVGETHLRVGEAAATFAVEGRSPGWVVFPATVGEVSGCLAVATAEGLAVVPTGRGARLHWGDPPMALDLVLSLRRLDRVLAHQPEDLTMSVEAGATLGAVNQRLAPHRQFLPLDPAGARDSTIGGIVATAASGPYRTRYGTMREALLGVTVVLADGTVVKGGGRVVKNATGFDMPKLHVGALGTLGVVVEAHLRLHARPAEERSWLHGFPGMELALAAGLVVTAAPVVASRLELLDRATLALLGVPDPPPAAVAVTFGSVAEGVRAQGERVAAICRDAGGTPVPVEIGDEFWRGVSDAASPTEVERGAWSHEVAARLTLRIGSRPTHVVEALRVVEAAAARGPRVRATAEVANGVLHAVLAGPELGSAPGCLARIRDGLARLGATCVVEHAPPDVKAGLDVWGDVGPALAVMRRLKAEFDPRGTLNPGRFVQGI